MKVAVTGASGFVGRFLVPTLIAAGIQPVLFGRSPERLMRQFPGLTCFGYDALARLSGCEVVIHLAVLNNDEGGTAADFHQVNVSLLNKIIQCADKAGVRRLINISTTHVLDESKTTEYARSKREAIKCLENHPEIEIVNILCPKIYSVYNSSRRRRAAEVKLFEFIWTALSAVKPAVNIDRLTAAIVESCRGPVRNFICADDQNHNPLYRLGKRLIDLGFALSVIVLFGWAIALIWIGVRATSPGPGIFAQARVGEGGQAFTCYKFRTMNLGTRQAGTHEICGSAVTPLGSWLRKTKLDELPQVWNILRGEISLVGPRPCLPVQSDVIEERMRRQVYAVKPGITGLAQINDVDMSQPKTLAEWDARYVALRSLAEDLKIFILTVVGRGKGDRVASQ